jgi:PhoH-like ATPase
MTKRYVTDTNILLDSIEGLKDYQIVLLSHTLRELEKHKSSHKEDLKFRAREITRYINGNKDKFHIDAKDYDGSKLGRYYDNRYEDNNILASCVENNYGIITNDVLLGFKAEGFGLEVISLNTLEESSDYSGIHDIYISSSKQDQDLLASLYENPKDNIFDLVKHQYLYVWDKDKPTYDKNGNHNGYEFIGNFRFDGETLRKLKYKQIHSKFMGEKVKPINKKQEMLFDLLQNNEVNIKMCLGKFGVGKDFLMITHALDLIENGKIDKLIWARNNVELADVPTLGILPGDKFEKLVEFAMPLADHVGGVEGLTMLIKQNKIEIQYLGSLRGRDIKNSIIYVTEFQNNTRDHAKLLVGRVGRGSQLWLNGDLKQTDKEVYKNNSGIKAITKLRGNELFSLATLDKTERSDTAELADLI